MKRKKSKTTTLIGAHIEEMKAVCRKQGATPESLEMLNQNIEDFYGNECRLKAICNNDPQALLTVLEHRKVEILGKNKYLDQHVMNFMFAFGGFLAAVLVGNMNIDADAITSLFRSSNLSSLLVEAIAKIILVLALLGGLSFFLSQGFMRNFISSFCSADGVEVLSSRKELRLIGRMMASIEREMNWREKAKPIARKKTRRRR